MAVRFQMKQSELKQIATLASTSSDILQKMLDDIKKVTEPPVSGKQIEAIFGKTLQPPEAARALTTMLVTLAAFKRLERIAGKDIVEGIDNALKELPERDRWTPQQLAEWDARKAVFLELIDAPQILAVVKFESLVFEHERVFRDARVVTEVRPVFDGKRDDILGAVILSRLRIAYSHAGQRRTLECALDEKDVRELMEECQSALKKIKVCEGQLGSKAPWKIHVPGRE